jgi:hypothetical protein
MSKIDFLKKEFADSEEEKSKDLADVNKEIYKKKKESKTLEKNAKKKQKELKKKERKALHSKKKVKSNKSKKTLGGKEPYDWSEETKSEYGENKETYIQLHVESDQSFKELILDIYFDKNAPNFFTNENKIRWRPTADEMDSILESFDILSQSSVSLEKKIDKLSKEFYFNSEKIEVEQSTSDPEQKEIDISPMSGDVFNKEQGQNSEDLKKNTEDRTLVNLEKKTDDLSESDKLSEVFITPPKKSTETEDVFPESREAKEEKKNTEDRTLVNLEKKTDDLSESDKLSEVFITPPKKSTEPNDFSPEFNEIGRGNENKEDTTPTNLEKKTDGLSESDELIEIFITPSKKSTETEDVFPESREAKEDNKNTEDTTPTNLEKKTDGLSESDKLSEVFKTSSEESPKIEEVVFNPEKIGVEPYTSDAKQEEIDISPMSGDVFNKEQEQGSEDLKKNTEDTTPTNLEKKTDYYPEESPKIEEVVFNPEKMEVEPPTSDSEQEEMHSRPRLDKVLFRRVEKT